MSEIKVKVTHSAWITLAVIILTIGVGLGIWANQINKSITLGWDAMPADQAWVSVRIYEVTDPKLPALVAEAPCSAAVPPVCPTEVTFTMSRAPHTYIARAYDGFWESGDSNSVNTPPPANAPTNLKKK